MSTLAILGGTPLRRDPFPRHPIVGDEEKRAVMDVLDRGELSTFIASPGRYFNGGVKIKEFERIFAEYHGTKHAVAFNSATAALHAAVVAVGVQPGEEVITTSYSFTSSATCALMHNAIPVFADVDPDIFCLDPKSVEQRISPLTRAVIPVHLFGHPADMDGFTALAKKRGLKIIEDCAQAPGARFRKSLAGTIADCGIFSFTENKNITTGEGGMLITNDDAIAEGARMVRNHGEMIVEGQAVRTYSPDMLGWNYRLCEMEAALGIVQFGRLEALNGARIELADYLTSKLTGVAGLTPPTIKFDSTHVYYIYAMKYDAQKTGIPRDVFVKALQAEGIPFFAGYVKPLYLTPIYHDHKPFAFKHYTGTATYDKGLCPVTESLYERELIQTQIARPPASREDMDDVIRAIHKVLDGRRALVDAGTIQG